MCKSTHREAVQETKYSILTPLDLPSSETDFLVYLQDHIAKKQEGAEYKVHNMGKCGGFSLRVGLSVEELEELEKELGSDGFLPIRQWVCLVKGL